MKRFSDTAIAILDELHTERLAYASEYLPLIDAANQLSEYENTGLLPKEIEIMREKLEKYEKEEAEGLIRRTPCKVGDTINAFEWNNEKQCIYILSDKVTAVTINRNGYTIKTKSKFRPIREVDGYEFAPVREYPNALADFYIGNESEAEAALQASLRKKHLFKRKKAMPTNVKLNGGTKYINMLEMWGREEYEVVGQPGDPTAHINFYLPTCFDVNDAFGLHIDEDKNGDYVDLYVDWYPENQSAEMSLCYMAEKDDTVFFVELDSQQMQKLKEVLPVICKEAYGETPDEIWKNLH